MSRQATIKDIAKTLRISTSTVSRALRNAPDVKLETRKAVISLSEELKYHPVDTIRTTKERADGKTKIDEFSWANLPILGHDAIETSLF